MVHAWHAQAKQRALDAGVVTALARVLASEQEEGALLGVRAHMLLSDLLRVEDMQARVQWECGRVCAAGCAGIHGPIGPAACGGHAGACQWECECVCVCVCAGVCAGNMCARAHRTRDKCVS